MGASTILLDPDTNDLVLDVNGNIAVATPPYSTAQDAACAITTYLGECYWDRTVGVPWLQQIFGLNPPLEYVKQQLVTAALTVEDVASAQIFISSFAGRTVAGQVQVVSKTTGTAAVASFSTVNPTGGG